MDADDKDYVCPGPFDGSCSKPRSPSDWIRSAAHIRNFRLRLCLVASEATKRDEQLWAPG